MNILYIYIHDMYVLIDDRLVRKLMQVNVFSVV